VSRVHGGSSGSASLAQGALGAMVLQSSPTRAREGEGNEAKPMRGSPEHERRRSGGAVVMKISGDSNSM
jgi:hypothetical protein